MLKIDLDDGINEEIVDGVNETETDVTKPDSAEKVWTEFV